ncbi:uncharacterized protein J4E84_004901 [Alternaria hordeiaustralica]|uniref:uncharacterized protein n=1 Tax=Alternaria hordeiaustralica TaxID=1187925 RepID=UPI0020C270AC|nr:uncharacterized protein J4E84_004901 [Alternaria hordeiaustralica]KAI4687973.1 hypothetical protein J4E84_004901 [Alternaria hordeiaustralica]
MYSMFLVHALLLIVLSYLPVAHHVSDVLFRHVLHINIFEFELQKHPSEDIVALLRINALSALLAPLIIYIYSLYFPSRHSGKDRPSDFSIDITWIVRSLHGMRVWCFGKKKPQTLSLSDCKQFYRSFSKMVDLSDARKKASKMSRKDLHRINRNNVSRCLHNSKIRLDREKLEKIQHALENKKLSLSVTALNDVINSLFSDLINPSTYDSLHTSNLDKLKQVHESVTRSDTTKDTRIRTLVAGHNDVSEDLRHKNAELDIARTEASDQKDDCQRLEARLQKLADNKSKIEESFRKCRYDLRQAEFNLTESSRRVANLETQIERTRMSARDADERAESINDELQDANRQLRDSERERAKLEAECDRLQTELKTSKEQLNGEAGLEKKTHDLNAAHEQIHQLQVDVSHLKTQHANAVADKDREVSSLKEHHAAIISSNDKDQQEEVKSLRTQLTATITAKDTELEVSRARHLTAIKLKDAELKAAIVARDSIQSEYLSNQLAHVNLQKDEDAKKLERLRIEHSTTITRKNEELGIAVSRHDDAMRELRGQFDLVTQQKEDEANKLKDLSIEHTAAMALKDQELDTIASRHESQMQELREELHLAKEQKANEAKKLQHSRSEHATAINLKNAELQEAHYELVIAISGKESEIGTLHTKHAAAISGKESEIGSLNTEHAATIARKDAELKKAHDDYAIAISGKESEIGSIHTEHATAISGKESEIGSLHTQHTAVIARKDEELEALRKDLDMAKLNKQPSSTDGLKVLVDSQQETILSMTNEWNAVYGIIENVNMCLPSVLKRLGKPLNDRLPEIRARMRRDSEFRPAEHLGDLETAMKIRRGRYELEGTFDHQWEFLKKFVPALVEAHPDVKELAKAIDDTFDRLEEQVVQPTKAPTIAPAPAKATPEKPPKDTCACKYRFLVTDSQDACRDHLDGCDDFAKWTPEKKKSLLGKLGLTGYQQPKQTKPKAESITCWHCEREFDKAHGQWFHGSHVKVCKRGAPSFDDVPGSSTPGPKTPVTTPSRRAPVIEHGWQNTGSAKKAETSDFVSSGMGSSKYLGFRDFGYSSDEGIGVFLD